MTNDNLLVFTGESSFQGFLGGAGFCPTTVGMPPFQAIFSQQLPFEVQKWRSGPRKRSRPLRLEKAFKTTRTEASLKIQTQVFQGWQKTPAILLHIISTLTYCVGVCCVLSGHTFQVAFFQHRSRFGFRITILTSQPP